MPSDIEKQLKEWFADFRKVVVAGIGNPIRSDDYVGIKIVKNLKGKVPPNVYLLECETVPESYIYDIEKFNPTHILLIDAAILGLNPGDVRLVKTEELHPSSAISSHMLPLRIFCDYLKASTEAKIGLLLVEPKSMEFGEGLSCEVEASAQRLTQILRGFLK
ncbi:MAG: hydrogenase 3 maturation endopeptidase HyCI [Candidatus Bathyarchaeota archaeon]|nr:hydrogenase 3 maturation endopeptidase HyCI [Candidatus Bathyarchaeota archaeon]